MVRILVRVTPRAARDEVSRLDANGTVHVRVTAPPVEGAANAAVVRLLAAKLGLALREVTLVAGATSRQKVFEVPLSGDDVGRRLAGP